MSVETALQELSRDPRFAGQVAHRVRLPARPARPAAFPPDLDPRLAASLAGRGVAYLYTHQAQAVAAALRDENVAVVTPAASGKTLCYNLPVLHRLLADPGARALYLFPTKALAQDQLAELQRLMAGLGPAGTTLSAGVYDGDTPASQRPRIRDGARIILSNPDMLHAGILPQHTRWAAFFANLRVVVIDEMHAYRGVFGSHIANVLRRLRRLCAFYGADPQFLLASATIANPEALATRLIEAPVTVVGPEQNGAPQGHREVLFYNPPLLDPALGIRRSSILEAADLAVHFLEHDVQAIVFCPTRLSTEIMLTYVRERLGTAARRAAVRGYRGGYLPLERREIEKGLRAGKVRCVVTTTALELGIDIGQLDAAILVGYPGTIAGARQQMGRAGRRQGASAGLLVAGPDAMDQYIIAHPEYLLGGSPEHARINPDNEVILAGHLACAAAELPLDAREGFGGAPDLRPLLDDLVEAGQLYASGGRYYWAGEGSPAAFGLRNASPDRVVIQAVREREAPQVIGEIDRTSVPLLAYEGAVYLHEGASYVVRRLDLEAGVAEVQAQETDYYTRPLLSERITVVEEKESRQVPDERAPAYRLAWGNVQIVSQASGYRIIRRNTNEVLGLGPIELPEQTLDTEGCWLAFSPELIETLRADGAWFADPNDYGPGWPAQRDAVRARDGYRCRGCGAAEPPGRQHDVHHRIPFRAFVADSALRPGLPAGEAWRVANLSDNLATLCTSCHRRAETAVRTRNGLAGVAALLAGIAPLMLMCDPRDLGQISEAQSPDSGLPTITFYERTPGGVGYAEQMVVLMPQLLRMARDVVTRCPCAAGCPGCVGPVLEHEYALDTKALATALLQRITQD